MGNYENIRPYAELVHEAAQHGGVEKYTDDLWNDGWQRGIDAERDTEPIKAVVLLSVGIAAWEGGKAVISWIRERRRNKQLALQQRSEEIKDKLIKELSKEKETAALADDDLIPDGSET